MKQINQYPIHQSPLYLLQSKKKLSELLGIEFKILKKLCDDSNYKVYSSTPKAIIPHRLFFKKERIIQEPNPILQMSHRAILRFLERISVPDYLHSAKKGKSYLTNAMAHIKNSEFYKVDIKSFYSSICIERVFDFFADKLRTSRDVAHLISNICCYKNMLPTGSCLSPLLSYHSNSEMFNSLYELSNKSKLTMTVYVDDIFFSGNDITRKNKFEIDKIIIGNGYKPHKKRHYKRGECPTITGLVVNNKLNEITDIPNKRKQKMLELVKEANKNNSVEMARSLSGMLNEAKQFNVKFTRLVFHKSSSTLKRMLKFKQI